MDGLKGDNRMDLIINTFGAYLHRSGEMFVVKVGDKVREESVRKIRSIIISEGATLSTDVIKLAIERNIDIVFLDLHGDPFGRVWHGRPGSTVTIRRQQLRIADTEVGVKWAKSWVRRKLENQVAYLLAVRERRSRLSAELSGKIQTLRETLSKIESLQGDLAEIRASLQGLEGSAGLCYWQAISLLLPERYRFKERSRNPAKDEFNCLLNYAYGMLYSEVERACILAGLDPFVGFIHTDNYNKKSFVFDLIECYRIWADETVVALFASRGTLKEDWFSKLHNGLRLDKLGKQGLMQPFKEFLDESIVYNKRNIKRLQVIQLDCHAFANELLELSP